MRNHQSGRELVAELDQHGGVGLALQDFEDKIERTIRLLMRQRIEVMERRPGPVGLVAQADLLQNPQGERGAHLVQREDRISTLRPGLARGPLVGGNLAVLSSLAGSPYFPDTRGAILFLEEVNEYIYRVDRMLSTLRLCGALDQLSGVVLGKFTQCGPGDGSYGTLTLDEVFDDYFLPLNIPVYRGAMIGHIKRKFTVPVGQPAEMDATAGTLRLLSPAVT